MSVEALWELDIVRLFEWASLSRFVLWDYKIWKKCSVGHGKCIQIFIVKPIYLKYVCYVQLGTFSEVHYEIRVQFKVPFNVHRSSSVDRFSVIKFPSHAPTWLGLCTGSCPPCCVGLHRCYCRHMSKTPSFCSFVVCVDSSTLRFPDSLFFNYIFLLALSLTDCTGLLTDYLP